MGGWVAMEDTIDTLRPLRWSAATRERKSPSPENRTMWSATEAISSASMASSMSMLPFTLRRPAESMNSLAGLVTTA